MKRELSTLKKKVSLSAVVLGSAFCLAACGGGSSFNVPGFGGGGDQTQAATTGAVTSQPLPLAGGPQPAPSQTGNTQAAAASAQPSAVPTAPTAATPTQAAAPLPAPQPAPQVAAVPASLPPSSTPDATQVALAPQQCPPGNVSVPGGPPVGVAGSTGAAGSLFDLGQGEANSGTQTSTAEAPERRRLLGVPFGGRARVSSSAQGKPEGPLRERDFAGDWLITDAGLTCACTVSLNVGGGPGGENGLAPQGCSAGNIARAAKWRIRGQSIVLLEEDNSMVGILEREDSGFSGRYTNATTAIMWRSGG